MQLPGARQKAKLGYQGHALMENRHGLVVNACATQASGTADWEAAVQMVTALPRQVTLGADKDYDLREFVKALRPLAVTPHVAQNTSNRASGIDGRTTRHLGYLVSQRKRTLVEDIFGWLKTVGQPHQTRHRGGVWTGSSPLPPPSTTKSAHGLPWPAC